MQQLATSGALGRRGPSGTRREQSDDGDDDNGLVSTAANEFGRGRLSHLEPTFGRRLRQLGPAQARHGRRGPRGRRPSPKSSASKRPRVESQTQNGRQFGRPSTLLYLLDNGGSDFGDARVCLRLRLRILRRRSLQKDRNGRTKIFL